MTREDLEHVREWADTKIAAGEEPPWFWYQLMKLRETLDAILAGMAVTVPLGSPESELHLETHLRLVGDADPLDSAPLRRVGLPVQLPS
jgi:hypothetical protein